MAKGDDYLHKKKSKAIRKRMNRVGADSLEAIQGVQAAKRRRKAGTRRACEGMCYTLPTLEDPFNERNDKKRKRKENSLLRKRRVPAGEILEFETYVDNTSGLHVDASAGYEKQLKRRRVSDDGQEEREIDAALQKSQRCQQNEEEKGVQGDCAARKSLEGNSRKGSLRSEDSCVPNFQASLLRKELDVNADEINEVVLAALMEAGLVSGENSYLNLVNGDTKKRTKEQGTVLRQQCWKAYTKGVDVVAISSLGWEERAVAYVGLAAVHIKAQRFKDTVLHKPLVLIIVATKDQAVQVRHVCKALKKTLGTSSVSVHSETSLECQTKGFSLRTPEIVVSTPERLLELLATKAVELSNISFLVIDGLDDIINKHLQSHLLKIKEQVSQGAQQLIICNKFPESAVSLIRLLVVDPIARVVSEPNVEASSACIKQTVSVFKSVSKRLPKMQNILQQFQRSNRVQGILVLVENTDAIEKLIPIIQRIGYTAVGLTGLEDSQLELLTKQLREGYVQTLVTTEEAVGRIPLDLMQNVVLYSFPSTIEVYKQILVGMARQSVHGVIHSLCTAAMAYLACDLVQVLRSCLQEVPSTLQMLADAASLLQNGKSCRQF